LAVLLRLTKTMVAVVPLRVAEKVMGIVPFQAAWATWAHPCRVIETAPTMMRIILLGGCAGGFR